MTYLAEGKENMRPVRLGRARATMHRLADGFLVRSDEALGPYPKVLTDRLIHWAGLSPNRTFAAKRHDGGEWRCLSYREALDQVRSLGQALLDRRLSADRPVAVLSENDLDHLLIMLAGQHVGIPTAHLSPVYSLVSRDFAQLRHALSLLTPGLVFVSSGERYRSAIEACVSEESELVVTSKPPGRRKTTMFYDLAATPPTAAVEAAHAAVDPD
jgi:feruloyl-CoA synthase